MSHAANSGPAAIALPAPRFEKAGAVLLAGLKDHFTSSTMDRISGLWERFGPHIGTIPGQIGRVAYGVWHNFQAAPFAMDCLVAVEIATAEKVLPEFDVLHVSPHRYAVFSHGGHVSAISRTVDVIFSSWLSASGYEHDSASKDGVAFFERYGENFDPRSGTGDIEIWVPIKE